MGAKDIMTQEAFKHDGKAWRLEEWFSDLDKATLLKLQQYHFELINFNGKMNLISPSTEKHCDQVHFADAVMGGKLILNDASAKEIYDLGSGNGFPGIVMACLAPERSFVLVDKDMKKVEFLKYISNQLGLKNVTVKEGLFEDLELNSIQCAVSRAVGNISKTVLSLRKYCAVGCEYYHFKSDAWVKEVSEIPTQLCSVWQPRLVGQYELPSNGPRLAIVCTKKIKD